MYRLFISIASVYALCQWKIHWGAEVEEEYSQQDVTNGNHTTRNDMGKGNNDKGTTDIPTHPHPTTPHFIHGENFTWQYQPFDLLLAPKLSCPNATFLLLFAITHPNNTNGRKAVRETWGETCTAANYSSLETQNCRLLFLMGTDKEKSQSKSVLSESKEFDDIVQYDFVDHYYNLTLKVLSMLRFSKEYCSHVPYALKADIDSVVDVKRIVDFAWQYRPVMSAVGQIYDNKAVLRDGRWAVPSHVYPREKYPPYAHGPCYLFSTDLVPGILREADKVKNWWTVEDAFFMGLLRRAAGGHVISVKIWLKWLFKRMLKRALKTPPLVIHDIHHTTTIYKLFDKLKACYNIKAACKFPKFQPKLIE